MKILDIFKSSEKKSDFSSFFSEPIATQKKVIKTAVRKANKEQQELYGRYKTSKLKTL